MFQTALLMISHKDDSCYAIIMKGQKAVADLRDNGEGGSRIEAPHTHLIKQMILHLSSTCVRFDGTTCKLII